MVNLWDEELKAYNKSHYSDVFKIDKEVTNTEITQELMVKISRAILDILNGYIDTPIEKISIDIENMHDVDSHNGKFSMKMGVLFTKDQEDGD